MTPAPKGGSYIELPDGTLVPDPEEAQAPQAPQAPHQTNADSEAPQ